MPKATLTINSRNYGSWSLRGWLLCRFAGLDFDEEVVDSHDPSVRAELLSLSPSYLVPCLNHDGLRVWDTLAIAEYLHEIDPTGALLPTDHARRAHCRSVSGEAHSGFTQLRTALPMNLRAHHPGFKVWAGAQADIDRIVTVWETALEQYGGPFLFGEQPTMADAMYAPVCTRFRTYDVHLKGRAAEYCTTMLALPEMVEWIKLAEAEPDDVEELEMEF